MDLLDDEPDAPPSRLEPYTRPEVLGIAAFVLAVASLLGFGVFNGSIVLILTETNGPPSSAAMVGAGLLGVALASLPVWMGLAAVRNLLEDDPLWTAAVARAAVLVGLVAVVMRLATTAAQAAGGGSHFITY